MNAVEDGNEEIIGCVGSKSTDFLQRGDTVSVVASYDDRISQSITDHLGRAVEGIRILSRPSCDEACVLIVVDLRRLHIANCRVA